MMKRILAASAAVASLAAFSAPADAQTVQFDLDGNVPATCNLSGMQAVSGASHTINLSGTAGGSIIDSTSGKLSVSGPQTVALGANWCNGTKTTVSVVATPLTTGAVPPSASFTNRVDYTVTGSFAGISNGTLNTAGGPVTGTSQSAPVGAFSDSADQMVITADANASQLLVAGDYTGTITVTLTPG
jgi:hypothetical protein